MEVDVKVLEEIAQDKEVVGWLEKAVENGTLLERCPAFSMNSCPNLCWKVWPDKRLKGCPCSKPHRLEIAQAIIALSKLVPEPKTYRVGDVFESDDSGVQYVLASPFRRREVFLVSINSFNCRWGDTATVIDDQRITQAEMDALFSRFKFTYLGHISELTIKNGKVVTP